MIRNKDYLKRQIGKQYVIVAVGEASRRFGGMIAVNETGSFLWDCLAEERTLDELTDAMMAEYEVDAVSARRDIAAFLETLKGAGALAE